MGFKRFKSLRALGLGLSIVGRMPGGLRAWCLGFRDRGFGDLETILESGTKPGTATWGLIALAQKSKR